MTEQEEKLSSGRKATARRGHFTGKQQPVDNESVENVRRERLHLLTIPLFSEEEEISEEYDDWDGNIHTYTSGSRHEHNRNRTNSADAGHIFRPADKGTNTSKYTPRPERKTRSQSFSERPSRRYSIHGTVKEHAMLSKRNSMGSATTNNTNSSTPSLTNGKHDQEIYKAVNEYYDRHANSFVNGKNVLDQKF
ncbi:hypothetical protein COOONC_08666 [Cooperia oncophora]